MSLFSILAENLCVLGETKAAPPPAEGGMLTERVVVVMRMMKVVPGCFQAGPRLFQAVGVNGGQPCVSGPICRRERPVPANHTLC